MPARCLTFARLTTTSTFTMGRPSASAPERPFISSSNAPLVPTRASCTRAFGPCSEKVISESPASRQRWRKSPYAKSLPLVTVWILG